LILNTNLVVDPTTRIVYNSHNSKGEADEQARLPQNGTDWEMPELRHQLLVRDKQ
jgi:hypothetical protein